MEQILKVPDGYPLAVTTYPPEAHNGHVVLINSAMGVYRKFYRRYAEFLAGEGFYVVTYDYRGIGDSRSGEHQETLWDWGAKDFTALITWCREQFPESSLAVIGHSVGGQIIGFTDHHAQIDTVLAITAQSGYWRHWSGFWRIFMFCLWYVMIPVACRLTGHLPKFLLGGTEDVPKGVALEWAKCGRLPNYIKEYYANHYFDAITLKMKLWGFEGDRFAPPNAVEALGKLYSNADVTVVHRSEKVGHFGFFRDKALWEESVKWL